MRLVSIYAVGLEHVPYVCSTSAVVLLELCPSLELALLSRCSDLFGNTGMRVLFCMWSKFRRTISATWPLVEC
jgi:hypothetical protein